MSSRTPHLPAVKMKGNGLRGTPSTEPTKNKAKPKMQQQQQLRTRAIKLRTIVRDIKGDVTRDEFEKDKEWMEHMLTEAAHIVLSSNIRESKYGLGIVSDLSMWNARGTADLLGGTWVERLEARLVRQRLSKETTVKLTRNYRNLVATLRRRRAKMLDIIFNRMDEDEPVAEQEPEQEPEQEQESKLEHAMLISVWLAAGLTMLLNANTK
jgi:hypothetical protein